MNKINCKTIIKTPNHQTLTYGAQFTICRLYFNLKYQLKIHKNQQSTLMALTNTLYLSICKFTIH